MRVSFNTDEFSTNNFKCSGECSTNLAKGTRFPSYGISPESKPRNTPCTPEQLGQTFWLKTHSSKPTFSMFPR